MTAESKGPVNEDVSSEEEHGLRGNNKLETSADLREQHTHTHISSFSTTHL